LAGLARLIGPRVPMEAGWAGGNRWSAFGVPPICYTWGAFDCQAEPGRSPSLPRRARFQIV